MDIEFAVGDKIIHKGRVYEFLKYENASGHHDILVFKSNKYVLRYPALRLLNDIYGKIVKRLPKDHSDSSSSLSK